VGWVDVAGFYLIELWWNKCRSWFPISHNYSQRKSRVYASILCQVMDLVPDVRSEWRVAAESTLGSRDFKQESCHLNLPMTGWVPK
jgi:hypothetical protein